MKKRNIFAIGCLTAMLGLGAFAGAVRNHLDKVQITRAESTESISGTRVFLDDKGWEMNWSYENGNPYAHLTNIVFTNNSGYSSISDIKNNAFGSSLTKYNSEVIVEMTWKSTEGAVRPYELIVPWYISSFDVTFTSGTFTRGELHDEANGAYKISASIGYEYKFACGWVGGYNPWYSNTSNQTGDGDGYDARYHSKITADSPVSGYTYSESKYLVSTATSGNGTVSPSLNGVNYYKNQILSLSATPSDNYSFASWSDSGEQSHNVYVTGDTTYTATFAQLEKLDAPVISKDGYVISWDAVNNAEGYLVYEGGTTTQLADDVLTYNVTKFGAGSNEIKVKAIGDHSTYADSDYSTSVTQTNTGYYLVGNKIGWSLNASAIALPSLGNGSYGTSYTTVEANEEIKIAYLASDNSTATWYNPGDDLLNVYYNQEAALAIYGGYTLTSYNTNNVIVSKIATYDVSINPSTSKYTVYCTSYSASYSVTIGETVVNLTSTNPGDDSIAKYTGKISASAGQQLVFKRNGTALTVSADGDDLSNNLSTVDNRVLDAVNNVDIYLKLQSNGTWDCWLAGRTHSYFVHVGNVYHPMTVNPDNSSEYMITNLSLAQSDELHIYDKEDVALYRFDQDTGLGFEHEGNSNTVTCTVAGSYNFYYDTTSYNEKLYISKLSPADIKATTFANAFLNAFRKDETHDGVCRENGSGDEYVASIVSAWETMATNYSNNIDGNEDAEHILATANRSGEGVYAEFAALYDTIYLRYHASLDGEVVGSGDFAGRDPQPFAQGSIVPQIAENNSITSSTAMVIGAVFMTTAVVASFVILKKKKEI